MAFKSSDSQNSEGRNRGGKDQKKKMKKMRSIKLPKLSSLNSSSRRATWQFDLSAIDLAIDELNSMESSDSKKENFEVETESEDTSVSSLSNSKPRLDQTPEQVPNASPDNSRPKSRSEGRKVIFKASPHAPEYSKNSGSLSGKIATNNFTRTPSMRSVRILKSKTSFKSRRPLMKKRSEEAIDSNVERATCSSTLKDSKFSKEIELHKGEKEVERISVMKVCPYHHCSLNGHCHGPEPVEKKPFLRRKKHSMKIQKSKRRENEERDLGEILFGGKSKSKNIFQENGFTAETEPRAMSSTGEIFQENGDGDAGEILFGGKSRSGKIFQENEDGNAGEVLNGGKLQPEKVSQENEGGGASEILFGGKSLPEKSSQENEGRDAGEILFGGKSQAEKIFQENLNQTSNFPGPRLKKENSISMWHLIHRQMVSGLKEEVEENKVGDPNKFSSSKKSLSRNISDADMGTEETEIRKTFAIKLVREAIEKILLPEVQDQSSDDQSVTSDVISEQENLEGSVSISTDSTKQEKARENDGNGEEKTGKSEKRAPKSWSYLKKVILLKRFVKELQKVKEYSPRKPRSRPLDHDQEAEKVSLRPQTTSEKRNSEEWMLDYAIRQVVSELAPKQKRKVALLVKAFETVAPPQEDQLIKVNVRKVKGGNQDFESNEVDNVALTSNFDSSDQITEAHGGKSREFELEGVKEENGVVSSSLICDHWEEINAKIEEKKGDSNEECESFNGSAPKKDSEDITEENGAVSSSNCHVLQEIDAEMEEKKGDSNEECESINGSTPMKDSEEVSEENGAFSSSSNCDVFEEINAKMEEKKGDSKEEYESNIGSTPIKDSEDNGIGHRAFKLRVKRENHISMWHLIHEQMVSGLAAESGTEPVCGANEEKQVDDVSTMNKDIESEETEMRKMFAIKLVREAIEKILLPEVQDQSFDDQSTTSDVSSEQDLNEKNRNEDFEKLKANNMEDDRSIEPKEESREDNNEEEKTERKEGSKQEKQKPKSWSYLKKVILLKRFVKELEKVKKFNPRKPNFLPLEPDQEAEKVSLRPQTVGEKRNTDEWMLDYAIRQVVSQLAPTQKRKVALLVKAFETVAPPNEDHSSVRHGGSKSSGKFVGLDAIHDIESNVSENIESSSSRELEEPVNEEREVKSRGFEPEILAIKTDKMPVEKQNHIKMWHMIYQHVVPGIAEKVGAELLLDGGVEDERVENVMNSRKYEAGYEEFDQKSQQRLEFSKSDAVKLVQEAVDEILDDSSDTQSTSGDSIATQDDCQSPAGVIIIAHEEEKERVIVRNEKQMSKNWSKLKKLILLKRSIKALANVRKRDPQPLKILAIKGDVAKEKVDLRSQMVDERKKAEQWMLDYAVQHIVTKLTPARKRRVAMLVEAFEAVVPLPEI